MDGETTGIIVSSGALGALCGVASTWIKAKFGQKTQVDPCPLPVQKIPDCVSIQECNRRMHELDDRMTKLEARVAVGFDNILRKLDAMDKRSEDRSAASFERMNPIAEKVSQIAGKVDIIEKKVFKV